MPITVRPARLEDAPTLVDFNAAMALETEHLTLNHDALARGVRAGIEDPAKARYFVADDGGRVVGMLMLTLEWSDWRDGEIWWIQSVYVHPEYRRLGIFKRLYRHVEALARASGAVGLRLYVVDHNAAAQATYVSLGMERSEYLVMENLHLREGR
jgi:ribosomal protein S18 acetylase RimI-like enzyme